MVLVNLELKDTDPTSIPKVTIKDVLLESRANYNELATAINSIINSVNEIKAKIDAHPNDQLKESIEFLDDEVKTRLLPELKSSMESNVNRVKADLTVKVDQNSVKIVDQEGHSRRRNIIINGVREEANEEIGTVVQNFLVRSMKFSDDVVNQFLYRDMHRLPRSKHATAESPKPIIVAFIRQCDRNTVIRNAFNLKGSDFSIKSDLPKHLNDLRGKMLAERKRLKEMNPTVNYRVNEKNYRPNLQFSNSTVKVHGVDRAKWVDIKFTVNHDV